MAPGPSSRGREEPTRRRVDLALGIGRMRPSCGNGREDLCRSAAPAPPLRQSDSGFGAVRSVPSSNRSSAAGPVGRTPQHRIGRSLFMPTITTRDGTQIFYKDWGPRDAQPIVFHHGWPLSADDWDNQMMFFLAEGYRVIAHDRRGHGRSSQTDGGHDDGHLCLGRCAAGRRARSAKRDPYRPFDRRRRSDALCRARRAGPGGEGDTGRCCAAAAGEDRVQPRGHADRSVQRAARGAGRQPLPILPRFRERTFLRLQPARRDGLAGDHLELVAAGDDGEHQGAAGMQPSLFRNRLHRGPEGNRGARAGDPQRGRPDRALCRFGAALGGAAEERDAQDL